MARSAVVFDILVASPSDVQEERRVVRDAIHDWNILHGRSRECVLEPVMWETHSTPEFGERPQAIINRQLVDQCDALIGTFWTKLGSPTGEAPSGTVEEIERISADGKPVMLYFSRKPVDPRRVDTAQFEALNRFQEKCKANSLFDEYHDNAELSRKLALGLTRLADRLLSRSSTNHFLKTFEDGAVASSWSADLRRLLKRWKLNADLRHQGHEDGKEMMRDFVEQYLERHDDLQDTRWEVLANLAQQMTRYQFTMGRESSRRFFDIGQALLTNAIALLENGSGTQPPVEEKALAILKAIEAGKSRDGRASAQYLADSLGTSIEELQPTIAMLLEMDFISSQTYFNAPDDYGLTGAGLVCLALHSGANS